MVKKNIEKSLKFCSKLILRKQRPWIVTITGSIGKTSTKEAVFSVLQEKFSTRTNIKSYNNEIGVPLTIIGKESPGKNIFGWLAVFSKAILLVFFKRSSYPKVLVLEIGADKKGDLKYLMEILKEGVLKIALLTAVSEAHLEAFGNLSDVYKEKSVPFFYLQDNGFAIIALDDVGISKVRDIISQKGAKIITYGIKNQADISAKNIIVSERGVECDIMKNNICIHFVLPRAVAECQLYSVLAGVSCGLLFGLDEVEIKQGLSSYHITSGRLKKISGINNSILLDDTYNSSPRAAKSALAALANLSFAKRKIAVLGDMLELGKESKKFHQEVGEFAKGLGLDLLVTFGKEAEIMKGDKNFSIYQEASDFLAGFIRQGDVILIKGSQGMRMEKITKSLMANPQNAKKMLVRQDKTWLKKS